MARRRAKDESLRRFRTEEDASSFVLPELRKHFDVYEEVCTVGPPPENERYRLDAVSICKESGYVLGWEFKRSHLYKKDFVDHLRQAIYYRMAYIDDDRLPQLRGQRPNACIAFPGWDGLHDDGSHCYAGEARGMQLLASHFRVGVVTFPEKREGFSIVIGESAVWHSWQGWTGNAAGVLKEKRPLASQRRHDQILHMIKNTTQ
ncbi:hypothetical protein [Sphingosinicella microcystinivorans]|uniref:hypothetical protein n=1 Tax=Sphingosinicella microcystinivorans TaxID=335406 RepID=UPI0022F3A1CF|nr:hypothetical protein [Sphingosinicella microcystinivorans]WBX83486.1 hypothetical protein PE061_17050 [Sphingosinicella microcystinivorans]